MHSTIGRKPEFEFYDPHPGLAGCPVRLPEHVRIVAEWLDGQRMTIKSAIDQLVAATSETDLTVQFRDCEGWISMKVGTWDDPPMNCWRVIRYKPATPEPDRD